MTTNNSAKNPILFIIIALIVIGVAIFALYFVDVDQTQEAVLPEVSVDVKDGALPDYDVDVGEVNVGKKKVTVEVPTFSIEPPEEDNSADN